MEDPFGQALLDHHRGTREEPLYQCDGTDRQIHPIEEFYFDTFESTTGSAWIEQHVEGPLIDIGAGAGRDTLYFQTQHETVALEVSQPLVRLLEERGVNDARRGDLFALVDQFARSRFRSAIIIGTQFWLASSRAALLGLFDDLRQILTEDGTVVLDGYDPTVAAASDMLGYRSDPDPHAGFRVKYYEYCDTAGPILLFRLISPEQLASTAQEAGWTLVDSIRPGNTYYYQAALEPR